MADSVSIQDSSQRAFDAFVGFIYATSIALLIRSAYLASNFDSPVSVILTLILLSFFAQDWLVRSRGREQMSGKTTEKPSPFFLKLFLEITIVYFLLLTSLRLVEIYGPVTLDNITRVLTDQGSLESAWATLMRYLGEFIDKKVACMMAVFAFVSGLWNSVMIAISLQVDYKHVQRIFKGHLDNEIIVLFPKIEGWIRAHKKRARIPDEPSVQDALSIILRSLVSNPHHLILPYLLTFHVVALNYILGMLIMLSTFLMQGNSIWGMQPFLFFSLTFILAALAILFLAFHFSSNERPIRYERLGCACIAINIFLLYSLLPAFALVLFVVIQQIAANYIMNKYFDPSGRTEDGKNQEEECLEKVND